MRRLGSFSRTAALVALGSFAVHLLRFAIAFASGSGDELRGQAFLGHVPPTLAAIGFALLLARFWVSYSGRTTAAGSSAGKGWQRSLAFGVAIVSVYIAQETLETALFTDHAQGLAGVLGNGAWLAVGLAFLFGPLCVLLDVGIGRLEARVSRSARLRLWGGATAFARPLVLARIAPKGLSPLAFGLAQRPPPAASR